MFFNNRNFGHVQSIYYTEMAKMYIMIMLIIFIVFSGIYYFYYLPKNQGKKWKFNQWKLQKGKKEQLKINYGIIFGLIGGVLFTATFPALIVDSLYAAYYIHKHPEYE